MRPRPDPTGSKSIDQLVNRARLGDVGAFNEIVSQTSPEVHALALRLTGNEHDACDVVQEAYLRAFRSIGRFRGDASVTTWLYRIVANCSATHHRKSKRRLETALLVALPESTAGSDELEAGSDGMVWRFDERRRLSEALGGLSLALRVPVVLHDVYGFDHAQIAKSLGISRSAAKVRLHRARRQLKDALSEPADNSGRARRPAAKIRIERGTRRAIAS